MPDWARCWQSQVLWQCWFGALRAGQVPDWAHCWQSQVLWQCWFGNFSVRRIWFTASPLERSLQPWAEVPEEMPIDEWVKKIVSAQLSELVSQGALRLAAPEEVHVWYYQLRREREDLAWGPVFLKEDGGLGFASSKEPLTDLVKRTRLRVIDQLTGTGALTVASGARLDRQGFREMLLPSGPPVADVRFRVHPRPPQPLTCRNLCGVCNQTLCSGSYHHF